MINPEQQCPSFEGCSAPLCPVSPSLDKSIWYPDEAICQRRKSLDFIRPKWVRTQRKVSRKAPTDDRYFTKEMLENIKAVRKPEGKDPDSWVNIEWTKEAPPDEDAKEILDEIHW
jgi:hypothetical protein